MTLAYLEKPSGAAIPNKGSSPGKNKRIRMKKRIAIFASGSGSNAQKLMELYKRNPEVEIALVLTNNPDAYVLQRADNFEIPTHIFDRNEFYHTDNIIDLLKNLDIDLI